jgi:hypothetical protein
MSEPAHPNQGEGIMTTLAPTGTAAVAADASTAMRDMFVTIVCLAAIAVILGVINGFLYARSDRTPTFAVDLARQSELRSEAGDHIGALQASRKATEVYRHLMRANAMHYAPYLAASLHDLSVRLGEAGDNAGALAAIAEAITIRRRLAGINPARYAESLEQSVQLRSQIESASHSEASTTVGTAPPDR